MPSVTLSPDVYRQGWDLAEWLETSFANDLMRAHRSKEEFKRLVAETDLAQEHGWLTAMGRATLAWLRKAYPGLGWPDAPAAVILPPTPIVKEKRERHDDWLAPSPTVKRTRLTEVPLIYSLRVTYPDQECTEVILTTQGPESSAELDLISTAVNAVMNGSTSARHKRAIVFMNEPPRYVVRLTPPPTEMQQEHLIYQLARLIRDARDTLSFVVAVSTQRWGGWIELPLFSFAKGALAKQDVPIGHHLEEALARHDKSVERAYVEAFIINTVLALESGWQTAPGQEYLREVRNLYPTLKWPLPLVLQPPRSSFVAPVVREPTIRVAWPGLTVASVSVSESHGRNESMITDLYAKTGEVLKGTAEARHVVRYDEEEHAYVIDVVPPPSDVLMRYLIFSLMCEAAWGNRVSFIAVASSAEDSRRWVQLPRFSFEIKGPPSRSIVEADGLERALVQHDKALELSFVEQYVCGTALCVESAWLTPEGTQYRQDVMQLYPELRWPPGPAAIPFRDGGDAMDLDAPESWPQPAPRPNTLLHRQWGEEFGAMTMDLSTDHCMKCGSPYAKLQGVRIANECGHAGFCEVRLLFTEATPPCRCIRGNVCC
jgi:hypothetical protein